MTEYVYKPVRMVKGKRVRSSLYSGAYSLGRGEKPRRVALHTPDRKVAEKRLRDLIVAGQQAFEGIVAPASIRSAAAASLSVLLGEYRADLNGRGLAVAHVKESVGRIERIFAATGWLRLADITPQAFVAWRGLQTCAAKTKKEYQVSLKAFLNWLVRMDRLQVNPLARIDNVDTRGKHVRLSRAYTVEEFTRLCQVAPASRRLVYQFLAYTGARKSEARGMLWGDLVLTGDRPQVMFRAELTKDKDTRVVPLKVELASELREILGCLRSIPDQAGADGAPVFERFPSDDALHGDLRRAGIERKDGRGRVLHFHAFRKTFNTWSAVNGVGQRSAQEMMGHSDPSLTAGPYTDVSALALHAEVEKLPWVGSGVVKRAEESASVATSDEFRKLLARLVTLAQPLVGQQKADSFESAKLAARHGFEP